MAITPKLGGVIAFFPKKKKKLNTQTLESQEFLNFLIFSIQINKPKASTYNDVKIVFQFLHFWDS